MEEREAHDEAIAFILRRRSIRRYESAPVGEELITSLLRAAMAAPTAAGKEPLRFVVVRDRARLSLISEGLPYGKMLPSAPAAIFVCGDLEQAQGQLIGYLVEDCCAAVENILLAAPALGLGACWLGVYPMEDRMAHLKSILNLPGRIVPVAGAALGYPAEVREPRTRFNPQYVHYETWS